MALTMTQCHKDVYPTHNSLSSFDSASVASGHDILGQECSRNALKLTVNKIALNSKAEIQSVLVVVTHLMIVRTLLQTVNV